MKFEEINEMRTEKRLTMVEAGSLLGVCERTFRRYVEQHRQGGIEALNDGRLRKQAHNAADTEEVAALIELYQNHYSGYSASHFFDKYRGKYKGRRCYNWVRLTLQKEGIRTAKRSKGGHRCKRPRSPMEGMMIHQDASTHEWVEGRMWDLIVTMDDATNRIYSAFFVDEEGTWSSMKGVGDVIEDRGLFCSFYSDRGSHYWYTDKASGKVDKQRLTQFGRAMQHLGIEMIAAYSPQARGRSERMFGTLQGRLPQELKSAGITTMDDANRFLKETFIPEFNERFGVQAEDELSAFVPWITTHINLNDILCIQEKRTVKKDNTVSYKNKILQIPKDPKRYSYARAKVTIHEYIDGSVSVFHGPRKLVSFEVIQGKEKERSKEACGLHEYGDNCFAVTHQIHEGPQALQQVV